jgi:hypothetical protein
MAVPLGQKTSRFQAFVPPHSQTLSTTEARPGRRVGFPPASRLRLGPASGATSP